RAHPVFLHTHSRMSGTSPPVGTKDGCHLVAIRGGFARGLGARDDAERLGMPWNGSEWPCYLFNQGRDICLTRFVLHARKHSGFIGANARSVVAPTGFEPVFQP